MTRQFRLIALAFEIAAHLPWVAHKQGRKHRPQ